MGLFDFLFGNKKKKEQERQGQMRQQQEAKRKTEQQNASKPQANNNLFSKTELENLIGTLSKISYLFRDSQLLKSTGGGRNESMMSRVHSYAGILGYYYEEEYKYGKMSSIVDSKIASHYALVSLAMSDPSHRKTTVKDLANNWSDVLQVIFNMQLEPNPEGDKFKAMESDINKVTKAFERLSGGKCREMKDPRKVTPRRVSYNPYQITEDPVRSRGHVIPDIKEVFAQELFPMLSSSRGDSKDIVANYAISMIKSYYDNAGFVPMVIVEQITGQISQVADMVERISYSPYSSLKEYVLSKIYK